MTTNTAKVTKTTSNQFQATVNNLYIGTYQSVKLAQTVCKGVQTYLKELDRIKQEKAEARKNLKSRNQEESSAAALALLRANPYDPLTSAKKTPTGAFQPLPRGISRSLSGYRVTGPKYLGTFPTLAEAELAQQKAGGFSRGPRKNSFTPSTGFEDRSLTL